MSAEPATFLGWAERPHEWTDDQGSRWKCIDGQWCWYNPASKCWHRSDRQLIEMSGPYVRADLPRSDH